MMRCFDGVGSETIWRYMDDLDKEVGRSGRSSVSQYLQQSCHKALVVCSKSLDGSQLDITVVARCVSLMQHCE